MTKTKNTPTEHEPQENTTNKILTITEQLSEEETIQAMVDTLDIIRENDGNQAVTDEIRGVLIQELDIDPEVAKGWKKVSDILDVIDLHELARNHPEVIGKMARKVASFVGIFYGPAGIVAQKIPDKVAAKVIEFAGFLTPEHVLNVVAKDQLNRAREKKKEELLLLEEQFKTTENQKLLVVVYQDEVLLNEIRTLVETNDDTEDAIVGTEDNSIKIVPWTKETWKNNFRDSRLNNAKILFVGTGEGTKNFLPETDIKFEKFGVSYGWVNNKAIIKADPKALEYKNYYKKFIQELKSLPLPETTKNSEKITGKTKTLVTVTASLLLGPIGTAGSLIGMHTKDKKTLVQQMLLYGVINLYNSDLEKFMNAQ